MMLQRLRLEGHTSSPTHCKMGEEGGKKEGAGEKVGCNGSRRCNKQEEEARADQDGHEV